METLDEVEVELEMELVEANVEMKVVVMGDGVIMVDWVCSKSDFYLIFINILNFLKDFLLW